MNAKEKEKGVEVTSDLDYRQHRPVVVRKEVEVEVEGGGGGSASLSLFPSKQREKEGNKNIRGEWEVKSEDSQG